MDVKYSFNPLFTPFTLSTVVCDSNVFSLFPQVSFQQMPLLKRDFPWSNKLWLTTLFYFTDHRFTSFAEVLYEISSLETILLGNNQVNLLDPSRLIKLTHLSTLDLSNNDLLKIPPELGLCTSLRYLQSTLLFTGYFLWK